MFDGDKNRKLRDEGTTKGEMVNSALLEFTMEGLIRLRDEKDTTALQYIYDAAHRGEPASARPAFIGLDDAGHRRVGPEGARMDVGPNPLIDDDGQNLRTEAYPIIRAALVRGDDGGFTIRNPLDVNHKVTTMLEEMTAGARKLGFNQSGTWRDGLDPESGRKPGS